MESGLGLTVGRVKVRFGVRGVGQGSEFGNEFKG